MLSLVWVLGLSGTGVSAPIAPSIAEAVIEIQTTAPKRRKKRKKARPKKKGGRQHSTQQSAHEHQNSATDDENEDPWGMDNNEDFDSGFGDLWDDEPASKTQRSPSKKRTKKSSTDPWADDDWGETDEGDSSAGFTFILLDENASADGSDVSLLGSYTTNAEGQWTGGLLNYAFVLAESGVIPALNETLLAEFSLAGTQLGTSDGQDFLFALPMAGVRWDFHLWPRIDAYGIVKFGYYLGLDGTTSDALSELNPWMWHGGGGLRVGLGPTDDPKRFHIRVESGLYATLIGGVGLQW